MTTLPQCDKTIAQCTLDTESGRVFLSNQLLALSNGKRLAKNMDVATATYIKTVQNLPLKDSHRKSFYTELASLVLFHSIPLITDKQTLLLIVNYHSQIVKYLDTWQIDLIFQSTSFEQIEYRCSFYNVIKLSYERLEHKLTTKREIEIFIRLILIRKSFGIT